MVSPAAPVLPLASPVAVCAAPPYHPLDDGLLEKSRLLPAARLKNSEVLNNLKSFLAHLPDSFRADSRYQISQISRDIDVEGHAPIKQHAYRINPAKRALMQQDVGYLIEHGLAVPNTCLEFSVCAGSKT